jgi:hypothetical protein
MGYQLGSGLFDHGRRMFAMAMACSLFVAGACGGDDDAAESAAPNVGQSDAATSTDGGEEGLRPCSEDRHLAVFDLLGVLIDTASIGYWVDAAVEEQPTPYPGTVEVVSAYRQRGYEVLYITTFAVGETVYDGRTFVDAVSQWLEAKGFPTGEGTHLWAWDGNRGPGGTTWTSITDELLRFKGEGVSVDVGYTENDDKAYAYLTAGVPGERIFVPESFSETVPSTHTAIPGDDYAAHVASVEELPEVCQAA